MADDCPRCGLHFERIEGHWIGAIGMNTIVSFGAIGLHVAAGMILTFPEFPLLPLITSGLAVAILVPLLFFPFAKTVWTAIDIAMRPLEPHEVNWMALGVPHSQAPTVHQSNNDERNDVDV